MTCAHALGRLICDRRDDHDSAAQGGHTYTATGAPDGHDLTEAAAERTRG